MKRRILRLGSALVATGVLAAVLVAAGSATQSSSTTIKAGGTLRVGWEQAFGFSDNFDPTGEYLGDAFGMYELLIRTLVNYKHVAGGDGNTIVPDVATSVPKPTNGGKTYTFHLKSGIKFGPPVNRAVTSKDFLYSMERLASKKDGAEYSFYYTEIKGWQAYADGKAKTISGIQTPNDSTIVFNLTQPFGIFLYTMTMPATGPIPEEVGKCFEGKPGKYSQDLVSTGGYMIQGMDQVNDSSCAALKPASGFDPNTHLFLVRNPNYVQSTDQYRKNYPDQVQFTIDSSDTDIFNKIEAGQLDLATSSIPPQVQEKYLTDPKLKQYAHINSGDRTWFITMNMSQPPFDDIHVRRAMNWIMDKQSLRQAWGGPPYGTIANHIVPDTLFNFKLQEYKPYGTPGDRGSVAKAKAAMKGSKYDTNNDGMCDAAACKGVLLISDARANDPKFVAVMEQDAKKIGITFTVRVINNAYPTIQAPAKNAPISNRPGWGKDFASPYTFFEPLFDGRNLIPAGNVNYPLVGVTQAQCKKFGITGDCAPYNPKTGLGIPSITKQLNQCAPLAANAQTACYENLDKYLMTNVVPWVPWVWANVIKITSSNVTHYQFDQFPTTPAYENISLK